MRDLGLSAEDVAEVEPLFTFNNARGEIEGVKYDKLSIVFINAFKEQQAQINNLKIENDRLQKLAAYDQNRLRRQEAELENLKQIVCQDHPRARGCTVSRKPK